MVECQGGAGDVADAAGAQGDALQRAPALLEFGGCAFAEGAEVSDQGVRGAGVGVEGFFRLSFRAADRDADADAGADVALVGQGRQSVGGCLVQRGQGVQPGGGDVRGGSRFGVGDLQWGAVGGGQELDVAAEAFVFLAEPQVVAVVPGTGEAVALDEHAVEDQETHLLLTAAVQNLVQVRGLSSEDIDALVQVAVAGGLGDAGVPGQAVHAAALTEPAQDQDRLPERAQRSRSARSVETTAMGGEKPGQVHHYVAGDVERGSIGTNVKPLVFRSGRSCERDPSYQGLHVCPQSGATCPIHPVLSGSYRLAKIISLRKPHWPSVGPFSCQA